MSYISKALRKQVIQRAKGLCEYCQMQQNLGFEMEIDHVEPESSGGTTTYANLAAACSSCNRHKSNTQLAIDPITSAVVPLFNPRTQVWREHFKWSGSATHLEGKTPVGRATIIALEINRELIVHARAIWVRAGLHPPKTD